MMYLVKKKIDKVNLENQNKMYFLKANIDKITLENKFDIFFEKIKGEENLKTFNDVNYCIKNYKSQINIKIYSKDNKKYNKNNIGNFVITNLRLIWYNKVFNDQNLSIGYNNIQNLEIEEIENNYFILSFNDKELSQYIFQIKDSRENINMLQFYIDLFNKGFYYRRILKNIDFKNNLIPENFKNEKIFLNLKNIDSYTSKTQIKGNLILSNYRLFWFDSLNENKVSIPLYQIKTVRKKIIKKLNIFIIEMNKYLNSNKFAFLSNDNNIDILMEEISNKIIFARNNIYFGITIKDLKEFEENNNYLIKNSNLNKEKVIKKDFFNENLGLIDNITKENILINDIEFNEELGLSIIKLPKNISLNNLWNIVNE